MLDRSDRPGNRCAPAGSCPQSGVLLRSPLLRVANCSACSRGTGIAWGTAARLPILATSSQSISFRNPSSSSAVRTATTRAAQCLPPSRLARLHRAKRARPRRRLRLSLSRMELQPRRYAACRPICAAGLRSHELRAQVRASSRRRRSDLRLLGGPPLGLEDVQTVLARSAAVYGWGDAKVAHRESYPVRANWKLVEENYMECYHCAPAHVEYSRFHLYARPVELNREADARLRERTRALGLEIADVDHWAEEACRVKRPSTVCARRWPMAR